MKAVPDQIRQFVPNEFATLGADGFGFSDTRAAARRFFKNDIHSIVVRTLQMLAAGARLTPRHRPRPSRSTVCSTSTPAPPATRAASPNHAG